jgi:hypothetical protein
MFNEISFPSHEGLPWEGSPPVVDGFTEPHPGLPVSAWRLEAGYVHGAKFTYDGSGGAHPAAMFQGVKQSGAPFLNLAFDVRFDPTFNNNDRVMLIIRPAFSPATAGSGDRRIDIMPVFSPGPGGGTSGGGAAASPVDPSDIAAPNYRTNRPPKGYEVYKRAAAGSATTWDNVTASVTGIEVKVSSSEPTAGAKNWTVEVKIPLTDAAAGGSANWVDISDDFGLYVNMLRITSAPGASGPEIGGQFSTQFTWPFDPTNPTANLLTDAGMGGPQPVENWDVAPGKLGEAHILAPGASNPAKGVKFVDGYLGIGVLQAGGTIGGSVDLRAPAMGAPETVNPMIARLINDHPTHDATNVSATFRIANFGLGTYGNNAAWDKVTSVPNPAPALGPIAHGGGITDVVSNWTASPADRTKYGAIWSDQCLWVELDSTSGAFFAESSVRRNLLIKVASEVEGTAEISGELPTPPAGGGGNHDYWLHLMKIPLYAAPSKEEPRPDFTHGRRGEGDGGDGDGGFSPPEESPPSDPQEVFDQLNASPLLTGELVMTDKPAVTWLWVAVGYWRTPETLTVEGKEHAIWINSGNFASVVHHALEPGQKPEDVDLDLEITGAGVQKAGPGIWFHVPHNGTKKLDTVVRAGTPEERKPKRLPWWKRLLLHIIRWLEGLLGKH